MGLAQMFYHLYLSGLEHRALPSVPCDYQLCDRSEDMLFVLRKCFEATKDGSRIYKKKNKKQRMAQSSC